MPYRRTDNVARKLAARHAAILSAAYRDAAAEGGMAAVQIAPVAERAGIATGTVYRYFPAKTDLVAELVRALAVEEIRGARWRRPRGAGAAVGAGRGVQRPSAPGCWRGAASQRRCWSNRSKPTSPRRARRIVRAVAVEFERLIATALAGGHLPEQDAAAVCHGRARRADRRTDRAGRVR